MTVICFGTVYNTSHRNLDFWMSCRIIHVKIAFCVVILRREEIPGHPGALMMLSCLQLPTRLEKQLKIYFQLENNRNNRWIA